MAEGWHPPPRELGEGGERELGPYILAPLPLLTVLHPLIPPEAALDSFWPVRNSLFRLALSAVTFFTFWFIAWSPPSV